MIQVRIPIKAELFLESEGLGAIKKWLYAYTFTGACNAACLDCIALARGSLTANLCVDPAHVKEQMALQGLDMEAP